MLAIYCCSTTYIPTIVVADTANRFDLHTTAMEFALTVGLCASKRP
jgi:hypothetical protein